MSESELEPGTGDFIVFPANSLVAVFHGVDMMSVAVNELKEEGFTSGDMRSFTGQAGMDGMDFDGSGHGRAAELLRYLQHFGPDRAYLERYEKYMSDGDSILMVHAPATSQKDIAANILKDHSAHSVTYFGTLVIEEV